MKRGERGGIFFRLLFLMFFFFFLVVFYLARRPLMRFAGDFWVLDEPAMPSDALIVLGDDNYRADRAFKAAELYRAGVAPVVVASGRMLRANVSLTDVMQHDLESFGVPSSAVVKLAHRAQNTQEEATEGARLIQSKGWKRIQVVTSNYHARRVRFIYERVVPRGVTVRVSGARDSEFDPSSWWETRQGEKLFLSELVGYFVARWQLREKTASQRGTSSTVLAASNRYDRRCAEGVGAATPTLPYLIGNTGGLHAPGARTIVRSLPSSPGCSATTPAGGYGVFGWGRN